MFIKIFFKLKQVAKNIVLIFFSPLLISFLLYLKFINFLRNIKVSFIIVENRYFGHFAINTEMSLLKYQADRYIGVFQSIKSCNKELEKIIYETIDMSLNSKLLLYSLNALSLFPNSICEYFQFLKFDYFREYKYLNLLNNDKILFSNYNKKVSKDFFIKNNLDYNKKIIALAIREKDYHKGLYGQNSQNYRNFDPNQYLQIIDLIIKSGFNVIKIGRNSKYKLPNKKNFFDYSSSDIQNDQYDLILLSQAEALVSTGFGVLAVGQVMRKKILILNYAPWQTFPTPLRNNWIIPSMIINKMTNKHADLREILGHNYIFFGLKHFNINNLKVEQQDIEIILSSLSEFIDYLNNNSIILKLDEMNEIFWKIYTNNINKNLLSLHRNIKCRLSKAYLEKYKFLYLN